MNGVVTTSRSRTEQSRLGVGLANPPSIISIGSFDQLTETLSPVCRLCIHQDLTSPAHTGSWRSQPAEREVKKKEEREKIWNLLSRSERKCGHKTINVFLFSFFSFETSNACFFLNSFSGPRTGIDTTVWKKSTCVGM